MVHSCTWLACCPWTPAAAYSPGYKKNNFRTFKGTVSHEILRVQKINPLQRGHICRWRSLTKQRYPIRFPVITNYSKLS
jgi:hypothetical protein